MVLSAFFMPSYSASLKDLSPSPLEANTTATLVAFSESSPAESLSDFPQATRDSIEQTASSMASHFFTFVNFILVSPFARLVLSCRLIGSRINKGRSVGLAQHHAS